MNNYDKINFVELKILNFFFKYMDNIIENWNVVEILFGLLCNYLFNINKNVNVL